LEARSHLMMGLISLMRLAGPWALSITCLCLPLLTPVHTASGFLYGHWGSKLSSSYLHGKHVLSVEPSPQPFYSFTHLFIYSPPPFFFFFFFALLYSPGWPPTIQTFCLSFLTAGITGVYHIIKPFSLFFKL
jgi:hypothetical protein